MCSSDLILELSVTVRGHLPFGDHPSSLFQPVERWIERTVLHLQKIVCGPLNVLANLVTVSRSVKKRPQDKHVESALKKIRAR